MHQRELPALNHEKIGGGTHLLCITLWFQLEDMFQSIVTPQGIEKVTIQLKETSTKVYSSYPTIYTTPKHTHNTIFH